MVCRYLEQEKEQLENRMSELRHEDRQIKREIQEITKFICVLQEKMDEQCEMFSPYEVNGKNKEKIKNLKKQLEEKELTSSEILSEMSTLDKKIMELCCLIKRVKLLEETSQCNEILMEGRHNQPNELYSHKFRLKTLEMQEAERQRIARDLHDSTVQKMTALVYKLEYCSRLIDIDSEQSKRELMQAGENLRDAISEMRHIIYELRPLALDDMAMEDVLLQELQELQRKTGIKTEFVVKGERCPHITDVTDIALFRIVQEACTNVVKHSQATKLRVKLSYLDEKIELRIIDNGKGFDSNGLKTTCNPGYGLGITAMKERVYLLSGKIVIKSHEGEGTEIYVSIPRKMEGRENENQSNDCR